ncbi:hypothetical protein ES332_A03G173100v1 [Gossypium tomentosum]|uniref:Uncharacterized protein n=1 Tax=Gossypium tomentosum TaxID=34277 RepID=A0A5D2R828_GOSTO|nr:hypothetical protein ES332_A03G173100v1 [Gossypium tomentosum]
MPHCEITLPLYKWRLDKCLHFIKFKSKKLSTTMDAANMLSTIVAEMGQLQYEIQEHRRVLNFLLRSVRTIAAKDRGLGVRDLGFRLISVF